MDPTIKEIIISDKPEDIKLTYSLESFSSSNLLPKIKETLFIECKDAEDAENTKIINSMTDENINTAFKNSNPFRNIGNSIFLNKSSMKLINIMRVFDLVKNNKNPINCSVINDAPGGFANALKYLYPNANITLISKINENNKWNIDLSKFNIFGNNNSGDILTELTNFIEYVNLKSNYEGIDIQTSYSSFENSSLKVIVSEMIIALKTLKLGGIMIMRLYDTYSEIYKQLLLLMSLCFNSMFIFKPITSNPNTNEKFLILISKKSNVLDIENILINVLNSEINNIISYDNNDKYVIDFNNWLNNVNNFLIKQKEYYNNKAIDYYNNIPLNYPMINIYKVFTLWDIPDNNYHIIKQIKNLNLDNQEIDIITFLPLSNLMEEYERWLSIKEIWNTFINLSNNSKIKYEIVKVIVRMFLWIFNYPNEYVKARDIAINELKNINVNIDNINFDKIMSKRVKNNKINLQPYINYDTGDIKYGLFKIKINVDNLKNLLLKHNNHADLIQLLLRYDIIKPDTGLFWSIPPSVYKYLDEVVKVDYEAFANPIYHNLENYFSPFNDLDKKYGSLGSFYDNELIPGKYVVNPPYSEKLLMLTTNKILNILEKGKGIYDFFIYYPNWVDSESIRKLLNSNFIKNSRVMNNNFICDLTKNTLINTKFDTIFIYLSNDNNSNVDFNTIINKFFENK